MFGKPLANVPKEFLYPCLGGGAVVVAGRLKDIL